MEILALLVFIPVQIIFLPLAIVGVILVFYKQMYVSKRLGVSSTAIEVIRIPLSKHWVSEDQLMR